MRRYALLGFVAALLGGCDRHDTGDEIRNGGDLVIVELFPAARTKAIAMVNRVDSLDASDIEPPALRDRVLSLYDRDALRAEIAGSPHHWIEGGNGGLCARTASRPKAEIILSKRHCSERVGTVSEAALILLNEAFHHLGEAREEVTGAATKALLAGWKRLRSSEPNNIEKRLLFATARFYAGEMLTRSFASGALDGWDATTVRLVTGRLDRQVHLWEDELPAAATAPERRCLQGGGENTVLFSYAACDATTWRGAAHYLLQRILVEEMGLSRRRAGVLLQALDRAWDSTGGTGRAHWLPFPGWYTGAHAWLRSGSSIAHAAWTGSQLTVWNPALADTPWQDVGFFDPRSGKWKGLSTHNSPKEWWAEGVAHTQKTAALRDGLFAFSDCHAVTRRSGAGDWLILRELAWKSVPSEGAPASRYSPQVLRWGDSVVVWGGFACDRFSAFVDGGIFDPARESWTRIKRPDGVPATRFLKAFALEDSLVFWDIVRREGYQMRRGEATWRPLHPENAPPRTPLLVSAGHHLVGYLERDDKTVLYAFDETARRWIEPVTTDFLGANPRGIWAGDRLLLFGKDVVAFFPYTRRVLRLSKSRGELSGEMFWTGVEVLFWNGIPNGSVRFVPGSATE